MKDISYKMSTPHVLHNLIMSIDDIEDGHWAMDVQFETVPCNLPQLAAVQTPGLLPGIMIRMVGINLVRLPEKSDNCLTIKDGKLFFPVPENECINATDSDNNGPITSDENP